MLVSVWIWLYNDVSWGARGKKNGAGAWPTGASLQEDLTFESKQTINFKANTPRERRTLRVKL